ncbi:MAG: DegT/DnrJ/EryC1/StrS family aminotransferase [Deltaproteobacteria bacterium]|nr:DegT/DnrJ/EryC1/StrS family aminotransferase [Deltaproteobacteria bacterium]MBW2400174.1 DegT/DnrJ/EryC1/StrS family aminotransferase [Deltaproteobacteria bacterium]MBW2664928.1 DegT/DnrJ/EryC1/StrS family aminotransferase [Deltaproteobacteria bacterium]
MDDTRRKWRIPMVDLASEYAEVGAEVEVAGLRVLRSGRYLLGPETRAFEAEFARLVGVREAVAVGSGTQSLVLALRAAGIGNGDEVITSPFTFVATVEAILLAGAIPTFADIESDGFNLAPEALEARRTAKTRAVMPVHLFGRCADMAGIGEVARALGLVVIEDAAQAIAADRDGRAAGSFGLAGGFSFYPSKNLGAVGDAGCVTTDDPEFALRLRRLRNHGQERGGAHLLAGMTARIDEIQAAVLRVKLPHLKRWNDRRTHNAVRYARNLVDCADLSLPAAGPEEAPAWSQYTLRSPRADEIRAALARAGIECRHYYPRPVYREPAFAAAAAAAPDCPNAERACVEAVSIPVHAGLDASAIDRVSEVVREALT